MAIFQFTCPNCKGAYDLTYFDAGWENIVEMRCNRCPTSLYVSGKNKFFLSIYYRFGGWNKRSADELCKALKNCDCGGEFKADAPYRCKLCLESIDIEGLMGKIPFGHYRKEGCFSNTGFSVIVARQIDGIDIFKENYKYPSIHLAFISGLFFRATRLVRKLLTRTHRTE